MVALYFGGIIIGILMALIFRSTLFKGGRSFCYGASKLPHARC